MPNFLQNVPQLMQYNRPNLAIIHHSEAITALTFATYLTDDTTETTALLWVPWASTDSPLTHSRWHHDSRNKRCQRMTTRIWSTSTCVLSLQESTSEKYRKCEYRLTDWCIIVMQFSNRVWGYFQKHIPISIYCDENFSIPLRVILRSWCWNISKCDAALLRLA
jgi:hypothetical protein